VTEETLVMGGADIYTNVEFRDRGCIVNYLHIVTAFWGS